MTFLFEQMLKILALYLEKQKGFIPKKYDLGRSLQIDQECSNRWRLQSQFSVKVLVRSRKERGALETKAEQFLNPFIKI